MNIKNIYVQYFLKTSLLVEIKLIKLNRIEEGRLRRRSSSFHSEEESEDDDETSENKSMFYFRIIN